MPDAAKATRPERPGRVPGDGVPGRPRRAAGLVRDAITGDLGAGLLGPRGPLITVLVTAFYVVAAISLAGWDVAVSFAIVPLVLAALTMRARPGMVVAALTFSTVVVAETIARTADFAAVEVIELTAFAVIGLALRLIVVRLASGRKEIARTAATLAATRSQVDEARVATERWVAQLEVAQRAAARMTVRPSVRDVAQAVAEEIRAIVDYHACRVYVLEGTDVLVPVVAAGENGYETIALEDLELKVGEGLTGWVAAHGHPVLVPDANADPRGVTIPGTDDIDESMVVVPMRYDERVTGVITLSKVGLRQFDLADVRILSILADQAAMAVESAKAISASTALAEDLRRIADMSSALSHSLDPRQVAELIAQHIGSAFGADECGISSWDRHGDRIVMKGYWPADRLESLEPVYALAGYPETRRVLESQTFAMIDTEDPAADPAEVELLLRDGQRSLVMVPLVAKGETIGLVELCGLGPLHLDARRIDLARAMANEAAMALANAQLYETTTGPRGPGSADRLLQPPLPSRAARRGDPARPAHRRAALGPDDRPGRLQGRERHPGAPLRRRRPALERGADPRRAARLRRRRPLRRRRVRGRPPGHPGGRRPRGGRADRGRAARQPLPGRGSRARLRRCLDRRRLVPGRRLHDPGPHLGRGCGALPGQEGRRTRGPGPRAPAPRGLRGRSRAGAAPLARAGRRAARGAAAGPHPPPGRLTGSTSRQPPGSTAGREWTQPARRPILLATVADPSRNRPAPPADPLEARVRRSWTLLAVAIAVLAGLVVAWIVVPVRPLAAAAVLALAGVAGAAALARRSVEQREAGRREEVDNFARILQGFSRAVSPDAIVDAIMGELGPGMGADHLVVVRRRPGAPILDATLIPTRPGAPSASTVLPAIDLDAGMPAPDVALGAGAPGGAIPVGPGRPTPADVADRAAERIAARVRRAFGLTNVLSAPLVAHGELLGAIVISRRRDTPWPEPAQRLLSAAATEASAALDRTVTHRATEAAATTDALTGLPNRRYFQEYVELLGKGRRADDTIGILMVDVDRFKLLNDRHGHAVGDVVLRAVARTIAAAVRDVDLPARYGGEEFVVLLRRPSRQVALEVGERIREAVEQIDLAAVGVEKVTVSVGATVGEGGSEQVEDLVGAADRALYRAKRFGRNRVESA